MDSPDVQIVVIASSSLGSAALSPGTVSGLVLTTFIGAGSTTLTNGNTNSNSVEELRVCDLLLWLLL